MVRGYVEWIAALPWSTATEDNLDLLHAGRVLDEDHYDIEQVKDRILEFLAVLSLKPDARGSILCFVGPPGVGKTSLGRSVARALDRRFERISVGGVRDESEIRGRRRTYIGAMPGTIIRALRDGGANNPLLMIDEIDKMGSDFRGDPSSAMLEVLDPEQHGTFRDHYLDITFDLSKVMVMKESAQAALSYIRSNASEVLPGLEEGWFADHDIHIHVPAGAIPKDGPSAGIAMATALASLLSGRAVRAEVAMTGEITLTGQVLSIGGLKALAAQRNGIRTVIAPALNEPDVEEIPAHLLKTLSFRFVSEIGEVLEAALQRRSAPAAQFQG